MGGGGPKSILCPVCTDIIIACKIVYMPGFAEIKHETRGYWDLYLLQKESLKLTFTYAM